MHLFFQQRKTSLRLNTRSIGEQSSEELVLRFYFATGRQSMRLGFLPPLREFSPVRIATPATIRFSVPCTTRTWLVATS